ncbi:MAG: hypothetical protein JNK35_03305 [Phycisphaerae bacterium]|nr:hypothetical protein [Phycisphaerae bacterium]
MDYDLSRSFVELCRSGEWRRASVIACAALSSPRLGYTRLMPEHVLEADETILPEGWDHEHCRACGWKLMHHPGLGITAEGWFEGDVAWLCDRCHKLLEAWWSANPAIKA